MDRPILDLTWDYPTEGAHDEPQRRGGAGRDQRLRTPTASCCPAYTELQADGSTSCGCWIYCGCYADGVNQTARRKPRERAELDRRRVGLGLAGQPPHPLQPRLGRPGRASRGPSARRSSGGTRSRANGSATTRPTSRSTSAPDYVPERGRDRPRRRSPATTRSSCRPTAAAGCTRRPASPTGRCRRTTSRRTRRSATSCTASSATRRARLYAHESNRYHPDPDEPGADVFPYVVTTYRLTEHFTAGGMTRWTPYLAELQPEFFCEVSPELAAERGLEHARLGDDRQRPRRDRGAGDGDRPDDAAAGRRADRSTRSACPTTGARTATPAATR